jgi:hypothetical protein
MRSKKPYGLHGTGKRRDIALISSICISRKKIKNVVRPTVGNKLPFGREAASHEGVDGRCTLSTTGIVNVDRKASDITSLHVDSANRRRDRSLATPEGTTYRLESLLNTVVVVQECLN